MKGYHKDSHNILIMKDLTEGSKEGRGKAGKPIHKNTKPLN